MATFTYNLLDSSGAVTCAVSVVAKSLKAADMKLKDMYPGVSSFRFCGKVDEQQDKLHEAIQLLESVNSDQVKKAVSLLREYADGRS